MNLPAVPIQPSTRPQRPWNSRRPPPQQAKLPVTRSSSRRASSSRLRSPSAGVTTRREPPRAASTAPTRLWQKQLPMSPMAASCWCRPSLRIACLTYLKRRGEDWPPGEFVPTEILLPSGERTTIQLAERGTRLNNGLWVREIRRLTDSGHQTAFVATDYRSAAAILASRMFARWSQ